MKRILNLATFIVVFLFSIISLQAQITEPGNCLYFDGSNDYVQVNKAVIPTSGDFTVEAWVFANTDLTGYREILSQPAAGGANFYIGMYFSIYNSSAIRIGDDWTYTYTDFPLDEKWHHIAVSKSDVSTLLYIDGILAASSPKSIRNPAGTEFRFARQYGTNAEYFKGKIDEVRIWNIARTAEEIQANMDTCLTGTENRLVAYYNFNNGTAGGDNNSVTTLTDRTGNGNNGTLYGMALIGATSNWVESYAMVRPVIIEPTDITPSSFTLNWIPPRLGTLDSYRLDVSTKSDFSDFVPGYNGSSVAANSTLSIITGLSALSNYYFRIWANKSSITGEGAYSNVGNITTTEPPDAPYINLEDSLVCYEDADAVSIDSTARVEYEGEFTSWRNGNLTIQLIENTRNTDQLSVDTTGLLSINGTTLYYNNSSIAMLNTSGGTITGNTPLIITFYSNATTPRVQHVLQSVQYNNLSNNPDSMKRIRVSATDYFSSTCHDTCMVFIEPDNDPPYKVINNTFSFYGYEQSSKSIDNTVLQYTDDDNTNNSLIYSITQLPKQGTLSISGTELGISDSFTQTDIDSKLLMYNITGNTFPLTDSCVFSLTDGTHILTNITLHIAATKLFSGGTGTKEQPFHISSIAQLDSIRFFINDHFILINDLDFDGTIFCSDSSVAGWLPIGSEPSPFQGAFNGNGHTISNLYINRGGTQNVGMFGYTKSAAIDSLGLVNANIQGQDYTGGLVGYCESSSIKNSYLTGVVKGGSCSGGLVGNTFKTSISFCYTAGSVSGVNTVGGLVGFNFTASVISNCYSTASVSGNKTVGGLVGSNFYSSSRVTNCYASGLINSNGSEIGGLVGFNFQAAVQNSFYNSETSGRNDTGKGIPKTTTEMKQQPTFSIWDFENSWGIRPDSTYPALLSVNNAPFSFADTEKGSLSAFLHNDFDYEPLHDNLVLQVNSALSLKSGTNYSSSMGDINNGDSLLIRYKVGEINKFNQNILWGNEAMSILVWNDIAPQFVNNKIHGIEDTPFKIYLDSLVNDTIDILNAEILVASKNGSTKGKYNYLEYIPDYDFNGADSLYLVINDWITGDTSWITIEVEPVNDVPVITSTAQTVATEDVEYNYDIAAFDVEDSTLTYSLLNAPEDMQITGTKITWTPTEGVLTSGEVILIVSDGELSATETFTITVNPVNDAPVISSTAPVTALEDVEYSYTVAAIDAEGSTLSYSLLNTPAGMRITDGKINWAPTEGILTSGEVTLTVSDGELSATETFTISVNPVNDKPAITSVAPATATEDEEYSYIITATDAEDSTLTYSLENAPEGMHITNDEITWIPTEGILTSGEVTLTVSDGELSATETFTIIVNPVNDLPVIISTAPLKAIWNEKYTYTIEAWDIDDNTLSYSLSDAPEGMVVTGNIVTWTPADGVTTSGEITLTVSDGEGAATQQFVISVSKANNAPVLTSVTAQTLTMNQSLVITLAMTDATDADGDVLVLVIGTGENYTEKGNTITPVEGFTGTLSVPINVSDGVGNSAVVSMEITVTIVDGIPAIITEQITLYPNPVSNVLRVAGFEGTAKASLYDLHGNLLLVEEISEQRAIQVSMLPQGMYILRIKTDRGIIERKIIKTETGSY